MDHVALPVQQNVPIVPVLDLQDVAEQRVASHRLQEGIAGLRVLFTTLPGLKLLLGPQLLDSLRDLLAEGLLQGVARFAPHARLLVRRLEVLLKCRELRARLL